jgi:hypothetical protein
MVFYTWGRNKLSYIKHSQRVSCKWFKTALDVKDILIIKPTRCTNFSNKFEKLVHLVGFSIRIYHDARSPERKIRKKYSADSDFIFSVSNHFDCLISYWILSRNLWSNAKFLLLRKALMWTGDLQQLSPRVNCTSSNMRRNYIVFLFRFWEYYCHHHMT